MTIEELIAALEAATEPSRKLDAAIWDTLGLVDEYHCRTWCRMNSRTDLTRDMFLEAWAPHFMSSVDDVLTILSPNAYWLLGAGKTRPDEPLYGAQVFRPGREKPIGAGESDVAPATAFSIACLRAREPRIKGDE